MFHRALRENLATGERAELLRDLRSTEDRLEENDRFFNFAAAPELTDYAIHERCALLARHSYLMRLIREIDGAATDAPSL